MSWFRRSDDRSRSATNRLREAEQHEEQAMQRMVKAGVQVAMNADTASDEIDKLIHGMEERKQEAERILLTVKGALQLLEKDRRQ
jgi:hypothetical protein